MRRLATLAVLLVAVGFTSRIASAQEYTFDVPEKLINITFESRAAVEDILGTTHQLSGRAKLGRSAAFELKVPVKSLNTGIALRNEHLQSEQWLNAARHPYITFSGERIRKVDDTHYEVTGTFTMHGVGVEKTITVEVRTISAARAKRAGLGEGDADWARVRADFDVSLADHRVKIPDQVAAKVEDTWKVKVSAFAKEK